MPEEKGEKCMRLAEEALHLSPDPPLHWVLSFISRVVAVEAFVASVLAHPLLLGICRGVPGEACVCVKWRGV